jgi:hypothetical protein
MRLSVLQGLKRIEQQYNAVLTRHFHAEPASCFWCHTLHTVQVQAACRTRTRMPEPYPRTWPDRAQPMRRMSTAVLHVTGGLEA